MPTLSLLGIVLADAWTVAHQITRERTDNPPDEWIRAFIGMCAERWGEEEALKQLVTYGEQARK